MRVSRDVESLTPTVGEHSRSGLAWAANDLFLPVAVQSGTAHLLYVIDAAGNLTRTLDQQESPASSAEGYLDGAHDGQSLLFGSAQGVWVIDPTTGAPAATVITRNGPRLLGANPIAGAGLTAIDAYRAVAVNGRGNNGNGSLWVADGVDLLLEIDLDGNILAVRPNLTGWDLHGLAWDAHTDTLFVAGTTPTQGGGSFEGIGRIDPATGTVLTSQIAMVDDEGAFSRGLDTGPTGPGGEFTLWHHEQRLGAMDTATLYRVHLYTGVTFVDGTREGGFVGSVDSTTLTDERVRTIEAGQVVRWSIRDPNGGPLVSPTAVAFNLSPESLMTGRTLLLPNVPLPEYVMLTATSTPSGSPLYDFSSVGGVTGAQIPAGVLPDGMVLRGQGLFYKRPDRGTRSVLMATNPLFFVVRERGRMGVEAVGPNSFNADTETGFWRITHRSGPMVVRVRLDWTASPNPQQTSMVFDVDQNAMADRFDGGLGAATGCLPTYRSGSASTVGLVATGSDSSSCGASGLPTGFIASNAGAGSGEHRTLEFRFTNLRLETFEFDCDTDGGQGVTGGDMAGLVVTVEFVGGAVVTDVLQPDPMRPDRSAVEIF